jgi:hypothetical protein
VPDDLARLFAMPVPWPASIYLFVPVPIGAPACRDLPAGVQPIYESAGAAVYVVMVPR